MRSAKAYFNRKGFNKACEMIADLTSDKLLAALAILGDKGDLKMIKMNKDVSQHVKEAVQALLLTTGKVLGTEGHRTALRHKSVTASLHFGYATIFLTPNLADGRAALVVNLHVGERSNHSDGMDTYRLCLLDEHPAMPTLEKCMSIIACNSVAQAK